MNLLARWVLADNVVGIDLVLHFQVGRTEAPNGDQVPPGCSDRTFCSVLSFYFAPRRSTADALIRLCGRRPNRSSDIERGREHINQLNRYLGDSFGNFGVLLTRHELSSAMTKNTIDLWSGKHRCIIALSDIDVAQMVEVFESKQRLRIDVVNKKYVEFHRPCPS